MKRVFLGGPEIPLKNKECELLPWDRLKGGLGVGGVEKKKKKKKRDVKGSELKSAA